jgi:ABC-type lipopolysaccharide export system ATPase subunit
MIGLTTLPFTAAVATVLVATAFAGAAVAEVAERTATTPMIDRVFMKRIGYLPEYASNYMALSLHKNLNSLLTQNAEQDCLLGVVFM